MPDEKETEVNIIERDFFYGVLSVIRNESLTSLVEDSLNSRFGSESNRKRTDVILVSEEWAKKLVEKPFHSSIFNHLTFVYS